MLGKALAARLLLVSFVSCRCSVGVEAAVINVETDADTYVRGGADSGNNYGTRAFAFMKEIVGGAGDYHRDGLFRFAIPAAIPPTQYVSDARLTLVFDDADSSGDSGGQRYNATLLGNDGWTETGVTFGNAPPEVEVLGSGFGPGSSGTCVGCILQIKLAAAAVERELRADRAISVRVHRELGQNQNVYL
jgi:hypothetical protein